MDAPRRSPSRHSFVSAVDLLWDVPLAGASFAFNKVTRLLLRSIAGIQVFRSSARAPQWRVLSAELLNRPLALPLIMTSAPRWNTHAIVATVGSLRVHRSLAVHTSVADSSAACWSMVVSSPAQRAVSNQAESAEPIAARDNG